MIAGGTLRPTRREARREEGDEAEEVEGEEGITKWIKRWVEKDR